jgi:hypothetical protein
MLKFFRKIRQKLLQDLSAGQVGIWQKLLFQKCIYAFLFSGILIPIPFRKISQWKDTRNFFLYFFQAGSLHFQVIKSKNHKVQLYLAENII